MRERLRVVLRRLVHGMQHGLDARYPLLLRRVGDRILRELSFRHVLHVCGARLFMVRNAYTAIIVVVVGTIVLSPLRRPIGLCQVLHALFHALRPLAASSLAFGARHTFCSTSCHFSPTRAARMLHMSRRTSMYACARTSNLTPSHCSAFCRSINRSWRLRQALADFWGKCFGEIWFQLRPWALACMRVSSSLVDHEELLVPAPAADAVDVVELRCGALSTLGILIMRKRLSYEIWNDDMTEEMYFGELMTKEDQTGKRDRGVLRLRETWS
jgi:hypothetical protein